MILFGYGEMISRYPIALTGEPAGILPLTAARNRCSKTMFARFVYTRFQQTRALCDTHKSVTLLINAFYIFTLLILTIVIKTQCLHSVKSIFLIIMIVLAYCRFYTIY